MPDVRDRMITEEIFLRDCQKHDEIHIGYKTKCHHWQEIGHVTLEKIKPIPGGRLQVKYKSNRNSNVRKDNVPDDIKVKRTRKWTIQDPPDDGFVAPNIIVIGGIKYQVSADDHHRLERLIPPPPPVKPVLLDPPQLNEVELQIALSQFSFANGLGPLISTIMESLATIPTSDLKHPLVDFVSSSKTMTTIDVE